VTVAGLEAGFGTAVRLEYLLVPLVFGIGAPVASMVGTNIGANQRARALRIAWTGAAISGGITSAIGTLKGPLHGGANEGVIKMLQEIGSLDRVDDYIAEALAQKKKIMGIGHRVYKTLDPRAPHLKRMAQILSAKLGEPKWIQMSERIAELMLKEKNLHANVDFYSASTYHTLGIDVDLFTPVFAVSRISGWTAHVIEQLDDNRLIRPRADYVGPSYPQHYIPIDRR